MKSEFFYHRGDGGVSIRASGGDIKHLAAEVGYLIHNLYSGLFRQSPELAKSFRHFVIQAMGPGTPTWEVNKPSPGGVEIVFATPKKDGE